jgi:hypothetical protein
MSQPHLDELERSAEAGIAALAPRLDAFEPLSAAALRRARAAVHCALDERWLAEREYTTMPPAALAELRRRVRSEAARASRRLPGWIGALSAAAMIALAAGLVRHVGSLGMSPAAVEPDQLTLFMEAAQTVLARDARDQPEQSEQPALRESEIDEADLSHELQAAIEKVMDQSGTSGEPVGSARPGLGSLG